ncbi:MAG: hypothetical protein RL508_1011 [Actinomycetota bacterium]|jgi:phosphonatase-like hydrolase
MIQLVAFDVAGTTVQDSGLVLRAFEEAFAKAVPEQWAERRDELVQYAIDTMGQSKIEVFTAMLGDVALAEVANVAFEAAYYNLVLTEGVVEIPGARTVIEELKRRGIRTALTTGFSRMTLDAILKSLGWENLVDVTVVPSEAGAGRPSPVMLQKAASMVGVTDPMDVVILGDTISDMEAGVAFGAGHRIGVLSGTHKREQLASAGATEVLNSVSDLQEVLFDN